MTLRLCLGNLLICHLRIVSELGNLDAECENPLTVRSRRGLVVSPGASSLPPSGDSCIREASFSGVAEASPSAQRNLRSRRRMRFVKGAPPLYCNDA